VPLSEAEQMQDLFGGGMSALTLLRTKSTAILAGLEITKAARNWLGNKLDASKRHQVMFIDRDDILNFYVASNLPLPSRANMTLRDFAKRTLAQLPDQQLSAGVKVCCGREADGRGSSPVRP